MKDVDRLCGGGGGSHKKLMGDTLVLSYYHTIIETYNHTDMQSYSHVQPSYQ